MSGEVIATRILKDSEELLIKMASPPLSKILVNVFLKTPELSKTEHESRMRLFGAFRNQSSDYFLVGELNGEIAGTLWYCTPANCRETAYMGEVFTEERQRRKGIATKLLEVAVDIFRKNGGGSIYVTNLCPRAPHEIYRKLGFRAYGYGQQSYGGIIRLIVNGRTEDFDGDYYKYDSITSIRNVNWGDLPHFIALLNYPHEWIVRAYNFGLIGPAVFDELGRSFMNFMKTVKPGNCCLVLEDSRKRMVGTAYSSSLLSRSQSHVKTVDLLVHPNYYGEASHLLETLTEELSRNKVDKLQAYAAAQDESKVEILRHCGFEKESTMQDQLLIGGKKVNLEAYSKHLMTEDDL